MKYKNRNYELDKKNQKIQEPSNFDKIKQLLKIGSKLVLVQRDELLNIKEIKRLKDNHITYINYLYNHYITLGLGKSYNY